MAIEEVPSIEEDPGPGADSLGKGKMRRWTAIKVGRVTASLATQRAPYMPPAGASMEDDVHKRLAEELMRDGFINRTLRPLH